MNSKVSLGIWQLFTMFLVMILLPLCGIRVAGKEVMPFLGYAGYLTFGLECGVIVDCCTSKSE